MPSKDTKILEFNHYQKWHKIPSIIYADLESLIKKLDVFKNNSTKSCKFDGIENKHIAYRG